MGWPCRTTAPIAMPDPTKAGVSKDGCGPLRASGAAPALERGQLQPPLHGFPLKKHIFLSKGKANLSARLFHQPLRSNLAKELAACLAFVSEDQIGHTCMIALMP